MKTIFLTACFICLSVSIIQAQETKEIHNENQNKQSLRIKVKDDVKPDIYVDGKKYDSEILELLDPDVIESMEVIKDERAIKEYNAPNGVILIKTKKKTDSSITIKGTGNLLSNTSTSPIIIIDGKVSSKEVLEKISSDEVKNIEVLKGDEALKNYNSESGVIIIKTKKGRLLAQKHEAVIVKAGTRIIDYFPISERYLYGDFTQGKATFKNKKVYSSEFNYNILSGEMEFINSNDTLVVTNQKDLSSIVVEQDTFYYHNGYLQIIRNGTLKVYLKHHIAIKDIHKKGAMGTVNRSAASEYDNYFLTNSLSRDMVVDIDMKLQREELYFFSTPEKEFVRFTKDRIIISVPGKSGVIKKYIKSNKIDFKSKNDLLQLADFVSKLLPAKS